MQTERSLHHFMFDHLRSVRFNPTSVITPLTAWFSAKKKYICHKTYISISSKTFFFVRDLSPSTKNSPWHHKYIYRFIHSAQCCSPTLTNIELPRQILIKSPQCPKCFGESPQSSVSLHTNIWNLLKYNTLQFFFFYGAYNPIAGYGLLILEVFRDHTQRHTTVGRTPLDEWSARLRDLYLTTLTTDKHPYPRQDSNPQTQQASGSRPTP